MRVVETDGVKEVDAEEFEHETFGTEDCGAEICGVDACGADATIAAPPTVKALVVATCVVVIVGVRLGIDAADEEDEEEESDWGAAHFDGRDVDAEVEPFDAIKVPAGATIVEDAVELQTCAKLFVEAERWSVEEESCIWEEEEEEEERGGISSANRRKVEGSQELRLELPPDMKEAPLEGPPYVEEVEENVPKDESKPGSWEGGGLGG